MSFKSFVALVVTFIVVLFGTIGFFQFVEKVPEGKVSVVYSPSGGAKEVINPGWSTIGLFDKTQQYPTRPIITKTKITVTTNDGKTVKIPVSYQVKVDKTKVLDIFRELGSQDIEQIQEGYLYQRLFIASRSVVSQYSVLDIYGTKAPEASAKIQQQMASSVEKLGFTVTELTLGSPAIDNATQQAIDARVKAAQQLEKLKLEKQIAQATAEKQKIEAEGKAAAKIAEAKGTAESNRLLEKSVTPLILQKQAIEKWNGQLPQVQGTQATPFINFK